MINGSTIEVLKGASVDVNCTCLDEAGAPVNVSAAYISFQVVELATRAPPLSSGTLLFQMNSGDVVPRIIRPTPGGGSNTFRVKVLGANTATRGHYRYRVITEWTDLDGYVVTRIWEGNFIIQ